MAFLVTRNTMFDAVRGCWRCSISRCTPHEDQLGALKGMRENKLAAGTVQHRWRRSEHELDREQMKTGCRLHYSDVTRVYDWLTTPGSICF
jgi:hypothetical protein